MKVKTSELIGAQLDYAVATAIGLRLTIQNGEAVNITANGDVFHHVRFTEFWSLCGKLIEDFDLVLKRITTSNEHWKASPHNSWSSGIDKDPKIAICRAVVASKIGDEVEIPDELMEVK